MSTLREIQLLFQNSLCNRDDSVVKYIAQPPNMEATDRLQVYYNDYYFRLRDALKDDYEILCKILDEDEFESLIKGYFEENPPKTFTLREIGYSFPDFLKKRSEKTSIIEMARFECEILKSMFAADADVFDMEALAAVNPEDWENLRLQLHPSVRSLLCEYNTLDLWLALGNDEALNSKQLEAPSTTLIWRYEHEVYFRSLTPEEAALFHAIEEGKTFPELCEKMLDYFDDSTVVESVASTLQTWINDGLFSNLNMR